MMRIEYLLQIAVATVAALGACLLSMEQGTTALAIVVTAAAALSVYVTDFRGWVDLPRGFSNMVAVIALVLTLAQISRIGDGSDLLALANLLVYLQVVLLFQRKVERDYWQIIALSLLQVVVAAALNLSMLFGILLGFYFFAALSAMTLLFLYREAVRAASPRRLATQAPHDVANAKAHAAVDRYTESPHAQPIPMDCWWRVLTVGIQTLLITVIVFFALPRLRGDDEPPTSQTFATTGMSAEVSLDGMETILESPETVLRLSLIDPATNKPFSFYSEPYIHGTVLIDYMRDGRWRYEHDTSISNLAEVPRGVKAIRQDVVLEPGRHPFLFAIAPAYIVPNRPSKPELGIEVFSHQISIKDRERFEFTEPFRYSLYTTSLNRGTQDTLREQPYSFRNDDELDNCLQFPAQLLPKLTQLAEDILTGVEPRPVDRASICRQLEGHFLRSGQYKYLLGRSADRRMDLDPIEDFVSNHKSGHCEYFASALTLMLRSQGIPARMVLGYKGGEFNELGKYQVVRQLHAHAWVEAYLQPEDATESPLSPKAGQHGLWLRLDPTPAGAAPGWEMPGLAIFNRINQWMDYSQVIWNQYVLGMNSERQQEAVYQPIMDRIAGWIRSLTSPRAWELFLTSLAAQFGISSVSVQKATLWAFAVMVVVSVVGLGSVVQLVRYLLGRWRTRQRYQDIPESVLQQVPFYVQMERVLGRLGQVRRREQTPREFAEQTAQQLAASGLAAEILTVPKLVVDAYYRVRFGNETVLADEVRQLLDMVRRFEQSTLRLPAPIDSPSARNQAPE